MFMGSHAPTKALRHPKPEFFGSLLMRLFPDPPPNIGPELLDHQSKRVVADLGSPYAGGILPGAIAGDVGHIMVSGMRMIAVS